MPLEDDDEVLWKLFDRYREYVRHQYDLTNHRTTWFVGINAFLFGTAGFTVQKKMEIINSTNPADAKLTALVLGDNFLSALSFVGSFSAIIAYLLIEAARQPIRGLSHQWAKRIGLTEPLLAAEVRQALTAQETNWILLVGGLDLNAARIGRYTAPLFTLVISWAWLFIYFYCVNTAPDIFSHPAASGMAWMVLMNIPSILICGLFILILFDLNPFAPRLGTYRDGKANPLR